MQSRVRLSARGRNRVPFEMHTSGLQERVIVGVECQEEAVEEETIYETAEVFSESGLAGDRDRFRARRVIGQGFGRNDIIGE